MRSGSFPGRPRSLCLRALPVGLGLLLGLALLASSAAPATARPYPPLPLSLDRDFLGNLTGPTLAPGASASLAFTVANPLSGPISGVEATFVVYAFNAFPGNASSTVPVAGAPVLTTPTTSGAWANVSVGSLAPAAVFRGSVGVVTSASTPDGAFAVRTSLAFTLDSNSTAYLLESRGWFSSATWLAATELPNGSATLNLSVLGVSGVTPETTVYVASSTWDWVLTGVLAGSLGLLGLGAWVYFRRGPGSRSGTR